MTSLLDLDPKNDDKQLIATKLKDVLSDSSIVLGSSVNQAYQLVLFRLAKYSGANKSFSDVIHYCKLGVDYSIRLKKFLSLRILLLFFLLLPTTD